MIEALAPLLLIAVAAGVREASGDARRPRATGCELAPQLLRGRPLPAPRRRPAAARRGRRGGDRRPHGPAPDHRRPRRPADRARLTGPLLQPLLARRPFAWLRFLGHPFAALPLWALNLYLWHLSVLYQGVLDSPLLHLAQHAGFLTFGLAMWLPLVGPLPKPAWFGDGRSSATSSSSACSRRCSRNVLIWSGGVLYPDYGPGELKHGISPLADQGAAGNVMMIWTGTVTLALFTWLFFRAANRSTERQELLDLADANGVELDPARAARAVAAGQGQRLRERILAGDGGVAGGLGKGA